MPSTWLAVLLPTLEAENLAQATREGGTLPTSSGGTRGRRFRCFWGPMEISAKDDKGDGDRAVACLSNGTLNGMHMYFKQML